MNNFSCIFAAKNNKYNTNLQLASQEFARQNIKLQKLQLFSGINTFQYSSDPLSSKIGGKHSNDDTLNSGSATYPIEDPSTIDPENSPQSDSGDATLLAGIESGSESMIHVSEGPSSLQITSDSGDTNGSLTAMKFSSNPVHEKQELFGNSLFWNNFQAFWRKLHKF